MGLSIINAPVAGAPAPSGVLPLINRSLGDIVQSVGSPPTPTIAWSSTTTIANAQTNNTWAYSAGTTNPLFGVYGIPVSKLGPRGTANPSNLSACGTSAVAGNIIPDMTFSFYLYDTVFEIINSGASQSYYVWIDDVFIGTLGAAILTGTAQAGGANTITLASSATGNNNVYNEAYIWITGGTGVGQIQQISSYVGSTKVMTVAANWSTAPDSTSTYSIVNSPFMVTTQPFGYISFTFPSMAVHKITIVTNALQGINTGPYGSIWPGPPRGQTRLVVIGDSLWYGTYSPQNPQKLIDRFAREMGMQPFNLSVGGTGWCTNYSFADRISPSPESKIVDSRSATAGTFTISITYGGSTQTTGALAFNASAATVQTAVNALSNVPGANIVVAGGLQYSPYVLLLHGMTGAVISADSSGLTGGTVVISPYLGDVAPAIPVNSSGIPQPFILLVPGSYNDVSGGFTPAQIQAAALTTAQAIARKFPTAITIFTGVLSVSDGGGSGVITTSDLANNAAISTAAAALPKINGLLAYINTYSNGLGGNCWVFGSGNISNPTTGKNDILKGAIVSGHPTGIGAQLLAVKTAVLCKALLGIA